MSKNTRATEALEALTTTIVERMESDPGGWTKPWVGTEPANAVTGRRYRGTNVLLLGLVAGEHGYASGRWATYKQWAGAGCQVRKGERSSVVVFYKTLTVADESTDDPDATKRIPMLRYSSVFAAEQVDGEHAERLAAAPHNAIRSDRAEAFVASTGATIRHGGGRAFYSHDADAITVPAPGNFVTDDDYYATVLHELTHWTGAPHRLDRTKGKRFGDDDYAREELVAELGSVFLANHLGIAHSPTDNSAAYLAHWTAHLRKSPRDLWAVVGEASAALDHLAALAEGDHDEQDDEDADELVAA